MEKTAHTGDDQTGSARRRWLLAVAVGLLACLVLISRRPDMWSAPQFWAEDGIIFFAQAASHGWSSLFTPYAGYLHLLPRIVANLTIGLPWEELPRLYMLVACLFTGVAAARIAGARLALTLRLLAVLALVSAPHNGEVFLNLTNLQWILNLLLVLNLLESAPETRRETIRRAGEILLTGLSSPLAIILAPFALLWGWSWRDVRLARWLVAVWAGVVLVQGGVFLGSDRVVTATVGEIAAALHWIVPQYSFALLLGQWHAYRPLLGWSAVLVVLAALGWIVSDRTNHQRPAFWGLGVGAIVVFCASKLGTVHWPNPYGGDSRYIFVPTVLLMWALAAAIAGTERRGPRTAALLLYVLMVWAAASRWTAESLPDLQWNQQVRAAALGQRDEFSVAPGGLVFPVPSRGRGMPPAP